jgi:hypothetical protein
MKKILLSIAVLIGSAALFAQNSDVYVVAGKSDVNYISFDKVKVLNVNGKFSEAVPFTQAGLNNTNVVTKTNKADCTCDLASTNYIAAMALDKNNNLVCMSMLGTNIFKHQNGEIVTFQNNETVNEKWDEKLLFARMATMPDGNIYALNNIGSELLKINSENNSVVSLGEVKGFSNIFSQFNNDKASFGGDMIADAKGNMYVITAFGHVVMIDMKTLSAFYVGQITNLPQNYTVNGAAVLKNNQILLASSQPNNFYTTDLSSLTAVYYSENNTPVYDLASSHFLKSPAKIIDNSSLLSIVPTAVKENNFNVLSNVDIDGLSQVNIYSTDGKLLQSQSKNISAGSNNITFAKVPNGFYVVKIINTKGETVNITKIEVF